MKKEDQPGETLSEANAGLADFGDTFAGLFPTVEEEEEEVPAMPPDFHRFLGCGG
jgi:hypothetical protein